MRLKLFLFTIALIFYGCMEDAKVNTPENDIDYYEDAENEDDFDESVAEDDSVEVDIEIDNDDDDSEPVETDQDEIDEVDETDVDEDVAQDCSKWEDSNAVIKNGSFMNWDDYYPDFWYGSKSEIGNELGNYLSEIKKVSENGHSCGNALQLINESDHSKRFTTKGQSLIAGVYNCSYWVTGGGYIRNNFYDGDYSSYTTYNTIINSDWEKIDYSFELIEDVVDDFELIFSTRYTSPDFDHLMIDDVSCERVPEFCDDIVCNEWEVCSNDEQKCISKEDRCGDDSECELHESCDLASHICTLKDGMCYDHTDCDVESEKPYCNETNSECIAGDPCSGVTCDEWKECSLDSGKCQISEERCQITSDCKKELPACDILTHNCVSVDHPANIIPNGGFELWSMYEIPYHGENLIPDNWYGIEFPDGDNTAATEIDPSKLVRYETETHSGSYALQIKFAGSVADRFTSEAFDFPIGSYNCHYFVRGKGNYRHRYYSSHGWSKDTDFLEVDSLLWQERSFDMSFNGNVRKFRFIFYVSNTDVSKDHVVIDDLACTKK